MGRFQPNAFGLYDMHGNALEWCSDWYNQNYYSNSPVNDPKGSAHCSSRVLRGGGFYVTPVALRCAARSGAGKSLVPCLRLRLSVGLQMWVTTISTELAAEICNHLLKPPPRHFEVEIFGLTRRGPS